MLYFLYLCECKCVCVYMFYIACGKMSPCLFVLWSTFHVSQIKQDSQWPFRKHAHWLHFGDLQPLDSHPMSLTAHTHSYTHIFMSHNGNGLFWISRSRLLAIPEPLGGTDMRGRKGIRTCGGGKVWKRCMTASPGVWDPHAFRSGRAHTFTIALMIITFKAKETVLTQTIFHILWSWRHRVRLW